MTQVLTTGDLYTDATRYKAVSTVAPWGRLIKSRKDCNMLIINLMTNDYIVLSLSLRFNLVMTLACPTTTIDVVLLGESR